MGHSYIGYESKTFNYWLIDGNLHLKSFVNHIAFNIDVDNSLSNTEKSIQNLANIDKY